jgi:hypothetical protein
VSAEQAAGKDSVAIRSLIWAGVVVPLAVAAFKGVLRVAGVERGFAALAGVGVSVFCGVYAFGPASWLADPDIAGRFGRDHPTAARLICGLGVLLGAAVAAFG